MVTIEDSIISCRNTNECKKFNEKAKCVKLRRRLGRLYRNKNRPINFDTFCRGTLKSRETGCCLVKPNKFFFKKIIQKKKKTHRITSSNLTKGIEERNAGDLFTSRTSPKPKTSSPKPNTRKKRSIFTKLFGKPPKKVVFNSRSNYRLRTTSGTPQMSIKFPTREFPTRGITPPLAKSTSSSNKFYTPPEPGNRPRAEAFRIPIESRRPSKSNSSIDYSIEYKRCDSKNPCVGYNDTCAKLKRRLSKFLPGKGKSINYTKNCKGIMGKTRVKGRNFGCCISAKKARGIEWKKLN